MITLLLIIIYLAFISLGLPDSLLGAAWPSMHMDFGMPIDSAGIITIFLTGSTIVSSFFSGYIIKKIGTGKITFFSCVVTGFSLLGISYSPSFIWIILLAIPLGLGAGSVDAALNNYVAINFKAHHMNWLHSFWGVGATAGPLIMAYSLKSTHSWRMGYRSISFIQLSLAIILLLSLSIWKKVSSKDESATDSQDSSYSSKGAMKIKGVSLSLLIFLMYCSMEFGVGLWGSSYLVKSRGFSITLGATLISMYYGGITLGRFLSGFVSFKLSNTQLIRYGLLTALLGSIILLIPMPTVVISISFVLIGLGLSPIFPSMLHETPKRFGEIHSQTIIGYQMAFGYIGGTFIPPILGLSLNRISMIIFPIFLVVLSSSMLFISEKISSITKDSN